MSKKPDSWIRDLSAIQNFILLADGPGSGGTSKRIPLKDILAAGFAPEHFISVATAEALLGQAGPAAAPSEFRDWLTGKLGFVPVKLGVESYCDVVRGWEVLGPMIYPFHEKSISEFEWRGQKGTYPSYGLSSYGYDIRLGNRFLIADDRRDLSNNNVVDMAVFPDSLGNARHFREVIADSIELQPLQFMLGFSPEHVHIPHNVIATCMQKSSVARLGINAFVTPLEPSWHGYITLEIVNTFAKPVRLYAGQGIMQVCFEENEPCDVTYADRKGKYMDQPARPIIAR